MHRRALVLVLAGIATACGSSGGTGNDGGGTGTGGTGGVTICSTTAGTSCTQAELNTYTTCIQNACASQYTTCYGPNYKTGSFGGTCGSFAQCQNACACTDQACRNACVLSSECMSCTNAIGTCSLGASCPLPGCLTAGIDASIPGLDGGIPGLDGGLPNWDGGLPFDAGSATCADLTTCCNAATMPSVKMACQVIAMGANDQICSATLGTYRMAGYCP